MKKFCVHIVVLFQVVVCMVVCSCRPPAATTSSVVTQESKDSTYREIPRLIPVIIPGATVRVNQTIECDSLTNKPKPASGSASDGRAKASFNLDAQGNLDVSGGCDSMRTVIEAKDTEIRVLEEKLRTESKSEVIPEYKTRNIDRIARIMAVILLVIIFFKIKKVLPV